MASKITIKNVPVRLGDHVRGERFIFDEWEIIEGLVTKIDPYYAGNDLKARLTLITETGDETWLDFDKKLEIITSPQPKPQTKPQPEPARLPAWAVGWCHYCGGAANTFGFFDEPVCRECGG